MRCALGPPTAATREALRVAGETRVDLVLSDAEATRIRDYTATRRLVRQCRVLIVM